MRREYNEKEKRKIGALVRQIQGIDPHIFMVIAPPHIQEILEPAAERRGENVTVWAYETLGIVAAAEARGFLLTRKKRSPGWRRWCVPPG